MRKFHMIWISVLVLLLGTTVTFGGGTYASATVTSDPPASQFTTGNHCVCAPGTGTYDWEYTLQATASAAIYGTGTGLAQGAGTAHVRGSIATNDVSEEAEVTSTGTDVHNREVSDFGTDSMVSTDCLEFSYTAWAYADWTTGDCTVEGNGFGGATGSITAP